MRALGMLIDRRRFLIGSALLGGSALLAACGGDDDEATATTGTGAATPTAGTDAATATTAPAGETPTSSSGAATPDATGSVASQIDVAGIQPGGTIVHGGISEIRLFNAILSGDSTTQRVISLMTDGMVLTDPDTLQAIPNLAESWNVSDDGLTYTFQINSGVTFHDGEPCTAADLAFTYQSAMNPDTTSVRAGTLNQRIASVEAPDDTNVVFTMKMPVPQFLVQNASYGVIPEHLMGDVAPADWPSADFNTNPIGTGAFKLKEFKQGESVTLEANPDHHRGAPALEGFIYKVVPDDTVLYQQLKTGEVDFTFITPDFVEDAQQQDNFTTFIYDQFSTTCYQINLDPARTTLFQDVEVRQAMAYAIDREGIVASIRNNLSVVAIGIYPTISWAYQPDLVPEELRYPYDPDKAIELLESAGWVEGSDGIREKDGQRLSFEMHARAGDNIQEGYIAVYQENWGAVGIEMEPIYVESSVLDELLDVTYAFDIIQTGFGWGADPDQSILWHSKSYKAGFNNMMYANAEVDRLLDEALSTNDTEKRKELYAQQQNLVLADMPAFVLDFTKGIWGVNNRVKNLIPNAVNLTFNPYQWYVTE